MVNAPCRFVVLPDFFADDTVVDACQLPVAAADIPGEHFLMHLLGRGEAIVMPVWEKSGSDARLRIQEAGAGRLIAHSEIPYSGGAIWLAFLEGSGIWHTRDIARSEAGTEIPLAWHRPFPAAWRVRESRVSKPSVGAAASRRAATPVYLSFFIERDRQHAYDDSNHGVVQR